MKPIAPFGKITPYHIVYSAFKFGVSAPFYLYDEDTIVKKCREARAMPKAFRLTVRYAMKANSNKAILQLINNEGLHIDASSLNEVRRANTAGVPIGKILLTTQEVHLGKEREDLESAVRAGLHYNVCSLRQLELIADFASQYRLPLSMRVHPGVGSGESSTRNTGDKYSCFGMHLTDIEKALKYAKAKGLVFERVHVHIGSGGDPKKWRENIDRELGFVERYFPDARIVNFGGGLKEARMPDEKAADIKDLGNYAKQKIERFYKRTGRKLRMEIEPGTYIMANAGYLVTRVIDKKQTGEDGFRFLVLDGGMEVNTRPLLYGSRNPFYVISEQGLLSSEWNMKDVKSKFVVVGRCCESGDAQTLDSEGHILERRMAEPEIGDAVVIGGAGAYCSAMSPFNYNSHTQATEVLLRKNGKLQLIRKEQTLEQMTQNELPLE